MMVPRYRLDMYISRNTWVKKHCRHVCCIVEDIKIKNVFFKLRISFMGGHCLPLFCTRRMPLEHVFRANIDTRHAPWILWRRYVTRLLSRHGYSVRPRPTLFFIILPTRLPINKSGKSACRSLISYRNLSTSVPSWGKFVATLLP